jgi:hypothetical protein
MDHIYIYIYMSFNYQIVTLVVVRSPRLLSMSLVLEYTKEDNTWVISKVLHTVRFLFKNKFILQNTFTGLQCHLHYALL